MDGDKIRDAVELGERIRGRRRELSMSQEEVAFTSRVTPRIISELEHGKPAAQFATILRVLEALGLDLYVNPR
jgi:transcriptional regulator with XRE-family HTH domain